MAGRRLANAGFVCAIASAALICASIAGDMGFNALVPPGQDSDQFNPTPLLSVLAALADLGALSFATLLAGCIFAVVGLSQHRSVRTWMALAANLALPAALIAAGEM